MRARDDFNAQREKGGIGLDARVALIGAGLLMALAAATVFWG
jgi:hypothetical protein